MRRITLQITLAIIFCSLASLTFAADTLIYNNTTSTGSNFTPQYYDGVFDYGTSTGGLVKKFSFGYRNPYSTTGWARVTFYSNPDIYYCEPGYHLKTINVYNIPPSSTAYSVHEYILAESERFTLPNGSFGFSILFSDSSTNLVLASGGTGQENELWNYYEDWQYGWGWYPFWFGGNPWAGLYMKIWKGPPIEDVTCDISGNKFHDVNGNGVWNVGEPGLPGWDIYLDTDNDGIHDASEPNVRTDPNGFYFFENKPSPATYRIREIIKAGWTQTLPGSSASYQYVVATEPNHVYGPYNFGNTTLPPGIKISGYVRLANGTAISGVRMETYENGVTPTGDITYTDASGFYELSVSNPWTGTVVSRKDQYEFSNPTFFSNLTISAVENITATCLYDGGDGTQISPYRIRTAEQLNAIGAQPNDWNKHFLLVENIDLSGYGGNEFNTIGTSSQPFTGVFDGNHLTLQNFTYVSVDELYVGLFAYVKGGDISIFNLVLTNPDVQIGSTTLISQVGILAGRVDTGSIVNCRINGGQITGSDTMGGLAGSAGTTASIMDCNITCSLTSDDTVGGVVGQNSGQINNCHFDGDVSGHRYLGGIVGKNGGSIEYCSSSGTITILQTPNTRYKAGGIAGYNSKSISYCHSSANVNGAEYMGGVVGDNYFADIYECYATGNVTGSIRLGGLVGYNHMSGIVNCYARGSVTGTGNAVGGLAGVNDHSYGTTRQIQNCYATGVVTGNTNKGGLVGYDSYGSGNFIKCFWNQTANPALNGIGNVTNAEVIGQSSANMKIRNTFDSVGWIFDNPWRICTDGIHYPNLWWQYAAPDFACPDGVGIEDFVQLSKCWNSVLDLQSDISGDQQINLADVAALGTYWMRIGCSACGGKDITGDGNVNMADLELLLDEWMLREIPACSNADLSGDKIIETDDLMLFCDNWLLQR